MELGGGSVGVKTDPGGLKNILAGATSDFLGFLLLYFSFFECLSALMNFSFVFLSISADDFVEVAILRVFDVYTMVVEVDIAVVEVKMPLSLLMVCFLFGFVLAVDAFAFIEGVKVSLVSCDIAVVGTVGSTLLVVCMVVVVSAVVVVEEVVAVVFVVVVVVGLVVTIVVGIAVVSTGESLKIVKLRGRFLNLTFSTLLSTFSFPNVFFLSPIVSFFMLTVNQGRGLPERLGSFLLVGGFSILRLLSEASLTCSEKACFSLVPGMCTFTLEGLLALKMSFNLSLLPFSLCSITCTWLLCNFLLLLLLRLLLSSDSSKIFSCLSGLVN